MGYAHTAELELSLAFAMHAGTELRRTRQRAPYRCLLTATTG
jgi:hypothetical protein